MGVTVRITTEGGSTSDSSDAGSINGNSTQAQAKDDSKVSGKKSPAKSLVIGFLTSQAKSWASAGVQSYTKYTGNSKLQQKINIAINGLTNTATVASSFLVGGIAGAGVATGAIVAQYGMTEFQNYMENKTSNRTVTINNEGLGTRNINGGRYGA